MQNLVLTQLSVPEVQQLFRGVIEDYFKDNPIQPKTETDEIGGIDLAVKITGLAKPTIYSLVSQRLIPFSKPSGKKLYFRRSELQKWIQDGKRKTTAEIESEADNHNN